MKNNKRLKVPYYNPANLIVDPDTLHKAFDTQKNHEDRITNWTRPSSRTRAHKEFGDKKPTRKEYEIYRSWMDHDHDRGPAPSPEERSVYNNLSKMPLSQAIRDDNEEIDEVRVRRINEGQLRAIVAESVRRILKEGYEPDRTFMGRPDPYGDAADAAEEMEYEKRLRNHLTSSAQFNTYEEFKQWCKYSDGYMHEAYLYYDPTNGSFKLNRGNGQDISIIVYPSSLTFESDDWGYGASYGGLVPEGFCCKCPEYTEIEGDAEEFLEDNPKISEEIEDIMYSKRINK